MNYRITTLELKEKEFQGTVSVYNNHSKISPGYLFRAGTPFEFLPCLIINKKPHRFCLELTEDLKLKSIQLYRNSTGVEASDSVKEKIFNSVRQQMAKILGKRVSKMKLPKHKKMKVRRFCRL